jgi:CRP/FNR family cyclic AMP-dependent transcriptional regulator|tara:strand:- start:1434 stop:2066 length:633 start_codon:yes stop_codon:yes gene_type:complete
VINKDPRHIENVESFLAHGHRKRYAAKSTIIYAGDKADIISYVVKGTVCVLVEDIRNNKEMIVAYLSAGEFFGELGLFEDGIRSAWIRAKTDCEICEIGYLKFTELYEKKPQLLFSVTKQIVKKLKKTTKNASNLAFLDVTGRLANTLIDLSSQADAISSPQGMQIKITRQELAKIIVCSREMVGRVLKQLQDEGLVIVNGKTITILRPK